MWPDYLGVIIFFELVNCCASSRKEESLILHGERAVTTWNGGASSIAHVYKTVSRQQTENKYRETRKG